MGAIPAWIGIVVCAAGCVAETGDDPATGVSTQDQVAWDPTPSKMPMWGCELPTAGAPVAGTTRTYKDATTVQNILDQRCNASCHDGQRNGAHPLSGNSRSHLYRWSAQRGVNLAMYAPQIVEALRDDGDGMPNTSGFDGAMWNQAGGLTESERETISDYFGYCRDNPSHNTVAFSHPQTTRKSYNHFLIGRSYMTGINWPNTAPAGDPGINNCDESSNQECVVDEQGLVQPDSDAEMSRFYQASKQQSLDTLGKWIATRTPHFVRFPGESIDDFRDRTSTAVYFNQNELGLGREMWCDTWPTGCNDQKGGGVPVCNIACGVTNYGYSNNDVPNALATATRRRMEKNTVVISYNKDLASAVNPITNDKYGAGYAVQFAAYGPTGQRLNEAQLDYQGQRPASYICTNCHGGWYDPSVHLVYEAKLLPANPHDVHYTDSQPFPLGTYDSTMKYVRTAVQAKLQKINELMYNWEKKQEDTSGPHYTQNDTDRMLLPAQLAWFEAIYCSNVPGCAQGNGNGGPFMFTGTAQHVAPTRNFEGWQTWGQYPCSDQRSQWVRDVYHYVIQPYCIGCHNAFIDAPYHFPTDQGIPGGIYNNADFGGSNPTVTFGRLLDHWGDIEKYYIRNARMPHAEHALKAFWSEMLTTDGTPTGAPLPTYDCTGAVSGWLTSDGTQKGAPYPSAKWLLYDRMSKPGMTGLILPEPLVGAGDSCSAAPGMCGDTDHAGRDCINNACVDHCDAVVHCPVPIDTAAGENPNRDQCVAATHTCEPCGRAGQKVCLVGAATSCDSTLNPGCMFVGLLRCESSTTEFSEYSAPDTAHGYTNVNRCLTNLADKDPREVDRETAIPGLIPTDPSTGTRLPTSIGTPGYALDPWVYPVPAGSTPVFANFTLTSTAPSAGTSSTFCSTTNCKERIVDGNGGTYFDSTATGGGYVILDFGRNRGIHAVQLERQNTSSTLLDDTNVYYQLDNSSQWVQIPAANGFGSGAFTINGFPAATTAVWVKVPVAAGAIRKLKIQRYCSTANCQQQIRLAEVKVYGY